MAHLELGGERRAVFVAHAAPGDLVRAEVQPGRPMRGRIVEVLAAGPGRVEPACRWSVRCGGCDWMHVSLEEQARAHTEHLRAALPGAWKDTPIALHAAPQPLQYRTRARVHVRAERGRLVVGMNEARTHDPVEVDTCAVLDPRVESARRRIAHWFDGSRGRGEVQIALGAGRRAVVDLRWKGEIVMPCFARLEHAVAGGELAGASVTVNDASRPATVGDPSPWLVAADGVGLRLASGGFAQANEAVSALLARHVAGLVEGCQVQRVVELYAGAGNLSVVLARHASELVLVESNRAACEAARDNLASRGLRARVAEADAEEYTWSASTELVVLDPPRIGARSVAQRLARSRVKHVVYVSCDTQTLARDLASLSTAYALRSAAAFEMFPQTSHVESVLWLERRRGSREAGSAS